MSDRFAGWRKSSASSANDGCAEVASRTSTNSAANGSCVAATAKRIVGVRDTKLPDSPVLEFSAEAWQSFTSRIKA
jgi:hypothetical protein